MGNRLAILSQCMMSHKRTSLRQQPIRSQAVWSTFAQDKRQRSTIREKSFVVQDLHIIQRITRKTEMEISGILAVRPSKHANSSLSLQKSPSRRG
jgi:hypothetical protein